jgi:hypothetical protein
VEKSRHLPQSSALWHCTVHVLHKFSHQLQFSDFWRFCALLSVLFFQKKRIFQPAIFLHFNGYIFYLQRNKYFLVERYGFWVAKNGGICAVFTYSVNFQRFQTDKTGNRHDFAHFYSGNVLFSFRVFVQLHPAKQVYANFICPMV